MGGGGNIGWGVIMCGGRGNIGWGSCCVRGMCAHACMCIVEDGSISIEF